MTTKSGNIMTVRLPRWPILILAGLLFLVGWLAFRATGARAQVQIDQVKPVASQIEGTAQGQVVASLPAGCTLSESSCETVDRSDLIGLLPGNAPPLPGNGSGNIAVIVQRGDNNDATANQQGSSNKASITQLNGNENEATVMQGPSDEFPGQNNLAVIVQNGSLNRTTIRQLGQNNIAGIRLAGSNNGITLEQTGSGNEYLLDFEGSSLGSAGNSTNHQVRQIGSNNRLVQVGEGRMPFNVRQRGNGMRMVIRHDGK
jgi:hypothetical protein